jgi:predicted phosphodiesterase
LFLATGTCVVDSRFPESAVSIVSDLHIRVLRLVAHQMRRELVDHDAVDHAGDPASPGRRQSLERTMRRTAARVADAEARRRDRRGPERFSKAIAKSAKRG